MAERKITIAPAEAVSPAQALTPVRGAAALRELPWCGKINVRGAASDSKFTAGVKSALGAAVPLAANTVTARDDVKIFWLGPDEWLVHCDIAKCGALLHGIESKLARVAHAATEVTDYYSVLEIAGGGAADALARGCPLDLHARAFAVHDCAQSRFGNASVLLHRVEAETFHVQTRWSFTEYVWEYLARAIESLPCAK